MRTSLRRHKSGFSSVLAILLTAFLVALSAGILFLFVAESRISRSLVDGFSAYAGAEGAMEYALLKVKNHREGFQDAMRRSSDDGMLFAAVSRRGSEMGYVLDAFANGYSGTVAPGEMDIVPLFFDRGRTLSTVDGLPFKDPRSATSDIEKTSDFQLSGDLPFGWNLIGSDASGNTFGIVGTGSSSASVGNSATATVTNGTMRRVDSNDDTVDASQGIGTFLSTYSDVYLVITNPGSTELAYRLQSSNGFSKPVVTLSAVGKAGNSISNLQFKENRSRQFDALRYSLFNAP